MDRRLALLQHHQVPDCLLENIRKLQVDGMSSEESDGEVGTQRTFKIKVLPWRSAELTRWLHRVDSMPTKNAHGQILVRRSNTRKRELSDISSKQRGAPQGLPQVFYNSSWFNSLGVRGLARLAATDDDCKLPGLDQFIRKQ